MKYLIICAFLLFCPGLASAQTSYKTGLNIISTLTEFNHRQINAYIKHETSIPGYNYLYMNGAKFIQGKNEVFPIPLSQIDLSVVNGKPVLEQNSNY